MIQSRLLVVQNVWHLWLQKYKKSPSELAYAAYSATPRLLWAELRYLYSLPDLLLRTNASVATRNFRAFILSLLARLHV